MTQGNVELVGTSLGQTATFREKVSCNPTVHQQVFTAIPSTVQWGQTFRILAPGGGVLNRQNDFKMFQNVRLSFTMSLGPVTPEIHGMQCNSLQCLNAIESIELLIDQQSVYHLERGSLGTLGLKYCNNVIKQTNNLGVKGYGIFDEMFGMKPDSNGAPGDLLFRSPKSSPAGFTDIEFSLPLSMIFDDLFTNVDSRFLGREWEVVVQLATMPPFQTNIHAGAPPVPGWKLYYSQSNVNPDPHIHVDMRAQYRWSNIRLEWEMLSLPKSIFTGDERIHTNQMFYANSVATHGGTRYAVQLGQSFRTLTHIRALYVWQQIAVDTPIGIFDAEIPPMIHGIIPLLDQSRVNIYWNGESIFKGDDNLSIDLLIDRYNQAEFSAHKLKRERLLGSQNTFPETNMAPCIERQYPIPVLIGYQTHTHKYDYGSEAVHSTVLWGVDNSCPTGYQIVFDFSKAFPQDSTIWQDQMIYALEASSTVHFKLQQDGRVAVKRVHN